MLVCPVGDDVHRILLWWFTTPERENPTLQQYQKRQPSEEGSKIDRLLHADRNFLAISWLAIGPILARGIKSIAPSTCNCREQLPEACLHPRKLATGDKWEMRI
ncbi:unnamed protein product [Sphagnum troendelagicum]